MVSKSTTEKEAVEVAQPVDNLPPTKPVVSGDVDQYDSDVMVLDRPEGRDADGVNNGLWGSDAGRFHLIMRWDGIRANLQVK